MTRRSFVIAAANASIASSIRDATCSVHAWVWYAWFIRCNIHSHKHSCVSHTY